MTRNVVSNLVQDLLIESLLMPGYQLHLTILQYNILSSTKKIFRQFQTNIADVGQHWPVLHLRCSSETVFEENFSAA